MVEKADIQAQDRRKNYDPCANTEDPNSAMLQVFKTMHIDQYSRLTRASTRESKRIRSQLSSCISSPRPQTQFKAVRMPANENLTASNNSLQQDSVDRMTRPNTQLMGKRNAVKRYFSTVQADSHFEPRAGAQTMLS